MSGIKDQWREWLSNVPHNQACVLLDVLKEDLDKQNASPVKVTRTPTNDLFVTSLPPYLDIFHLHDVYDRLAFKSNVLVKGPKGDGKSLSVITYAHKTQTPIVIQECSEDTKKMDLMGSQTLLGDETIFTLGCIPSAIDTANEYGRCILLLEELSALTPQVQKQLNAVTDFRRQCSMPFLGKTYKLREGAQLWVVGTMNPSVYGGTYDLNEDLKSRFEEIDLTYPQPGQEKQILQMACKHIMGTKLPSVFRTSHGGQVVEIQHMDDIILSFVIKLAGETRQQATGYALSTRDLVRFVETIALLGLERALQLVLCKFEGEEDKKTMKTRIGSIFGNMNIQSYWGT